MRCIKEERIEYVKMLHNAKLDDVEYKDWPQYQAFIELTRRWYVFREVKEILERIIDPTIEDRDKEITEVLGITTNICLTKRPQRQSY